jgi:hypothetical protein
VPDTTESTESALVEVTPGTAVVFGRVPEGLELIPFSLISADDKSAIGDAVATMSSVLNVGGQLASGLAQAQGLVRLAPETIQALQAGATPIKSGGYYLGTLRHGTKFSNSVRWLPASGANAAGIVASLGPAIAMIAIQVQLSELSGLVRQNLALTETVLKSVRNQQWAELTGLEQAITKAVDEANSVGQVTPLLWQNVAGYEAALRKQRDLFRRNVELHAAELLKRTSHKERRQYIEKNGEAILLDLHSLLIAHKAWFEYQSIRAGRARASAADDEREAKLLQTIVDNARQEYAQTVDQITAIADVLNRQLWILAELPGKRTLPFTGGRRSAKEVARMAEQLSAGVQRLSHSTLTVPAPIEIPPICFAKKSSQLDQDLRILRWHMEGDESLDAIAIARDAGVGLGRVGNAVAGFGGAFLDGVGGVAKAVGEVGENGLSGVERALRRGSEANLSAVVEPGTEILVAVTDRRVLIAEISQLRQEGTIRSSVPNNQIRFVRLRDDDSKDRAELDLITETANETWRFRRGSSSAEPVKALASLLSSRMDVPDGERRSISGREPNELPVPDVSS